MARRATGIIARQQGVEAQPISTVTWLPRGKLRANSFNPNKQAPPEFALLKRSILEDGWLAAINIRTDFEIVDGYHRWLIAADPEVAAMTGGLVPTVMLTTTPAQQRLTTIRMNRARGTHGVVKMADIVDELLAMGLDAKEIGARLGMEPEEVRRLLDRGAMLKRDGEFSVAWSPAPGKGVRK